MIKHARRSVTAVGDRSIRTLAVDRLAVKANYVHVSFADCQTITHGLHPEKVKNTWNNDWLTVALEVLDGQSRRACVSATTGTRSVVVREHDSSIIWLQVS